VGPTRPPIQLALHATGPDQGAEEGRSGGHTLSSGLARSTFGGVAQRVGAMVWPFYRTGWCAHHLDRITRCSGLLRGLPIAFLGMRAYQQCRGLALARSLYRISNYTFRFPFLFTIHARYIKDSPLFDSNYRPGPQGNRDDWGKVTSAFAQFLGCTFLSAIMDNNYRCGFCHSRGIHGF